MATYPELLANKSFRRLWISQAISNTGDWLVVGLVLELVGKFSGNSASAAGAVMSVKILPALLLGAVIGVLVDRFDRKRVMIVSDVARAVLVLLLVFARHLWQVYALVFLSETFALLFIPARNATTPNVVDRSSLAEANSLSYTTDQVTMFLGLVSGSTLLLLFNTLAGKLGVSSIPILGPYVGKYLGAQAGLTLDALSFVASAALIWGIHVRRCETRYEPLTPSLVGRDVVEGLRFLREDVSLRSTMLGVAAATLGIGTIYTAGMPYSSDVLNLGKGAAGFMAMVAVFAGGMLVGAFLAAPVGRKYGHRKALTWGLGAFGFALFLFALTSSRILAAAVMVPAGAAMAILYVNGWTYMQESAEDSIRGRVFVTFETLLRVSLLVSLMASGFVADFLRRLLSKAHINTVFLSGPRVTLLGGALIVMVAAVATGLASRRVPIPAVAGEPAESGGEGS